ncbi:ubiquinone biosynthesis protein COQ4, partial [Tremellales sp. Uapishka_1]
MKALQTPAFRSTLASSSRIRRGISTVNYPGHVPLNFAQNALLAVGSGVVGVMDPTRGDLIATLSESTASTFLPALHAEMNSRPEGRQILRDRPLVSSQTVDLVKLKEMKRGTLGREYVDWLERGNVTPDTRASVSCTWKDGVDVWLTESGPQVKYIDSPTLAYTMLRYRQTHDLYHTLFSLPPTLPHELTLKVIELTNMSLPVAALSSLFGPLRLSHKRREVWLKDWAPWALRMGRQGTSLVGVYWEKRWEQGVGELRRELGVSRNEDRGVEARWRGYRELREREREFRRKGDWVDEPEEW